MDTSQFNTHQPPFEGLQAMTTSGATCDTFRVKLYGKLHFLKRLKPQFLGDIRYVEAQRKEFETGYRLEHPNIVRYISLSPEGILMEYVDGETLTDRLHAHPDFFRSRQNVDKFLRQLLDAVGYLHAHQVLHLDLKPDNIMLTRIGNDVKLIDLGCCCTDTFDDTQGHTPAFAAPEQLASGRVDERTDIYALGKIIALLPLRHIYNKVVARCTAENPADRYQSVEDLAKAVGSRRKLYRNAIILLFALALIASVVLLSIGHDDEATIEVQKATDTLAATPNSPAPQADVDSITKSSPHPSLNTSSQSSVLSSPQPSVLPSPQPSAGVAGDATAQMEKEMDVLLDSAYRSTIITFCDSVFPSLSVGRQWEKQTSEFHAQALQVAADLSRKYADIPESVIMQHVESRFQSLVGYVFNCMRENGKR